MNRFRIGLILLAALLAAGIWAQSTMQRIHLPIAAALENAADYAAAGEPSRAAELVHHAESQWQRSRTLTAALADHQPLEDIECLLAQLTAYETADDPTYPALCRDLARRLRAVAEAHSLSLGAVF